MESISPDRHRPEKRREMLRLSLVLIAITIATKVLAYVIQAKKASYFGRGTVVDCFEWAILFPTLIYSFAFNVLNVLLVPIFSGRKASPSLDRAYHALVSWCVAAFLLLGVILFAMAPSLVAWLSKFDDPRGIQLGTLFLRILACATFFIGVEGVQSGFLLAEKRVISVALVRLLKEIVFVAVLLVGLWWAAGRWFADPMLPLAWLSAAAVGGVLFFALGVRRHRFTFRFVHLDDYIRRLIRNLWPVLVLFVLITVNELVRAKLLTGQKADLSTFRFAYYIFLLPHALIAENLVLFLFPMMAAEINQGDLGRLRHSIRSGVKLMLFFILPASVGLIVLAQPIVQLLYERGKFEDEDTLATMMPLIYLALGMWAFSLHVLFARTLDALQAYWRRVAIEAPFVLLSVALSWWWISRYRSNGAAWAFTVPFVVLLALEIWQVRRRIGTIRMGLIAADLVKIGAATAAMAAATWLAYQWSSRWLPGTGGWALLSRLSVAMAVALVVYFGASLLLRIIRGSDVAELRDYFLFRRQTASNSQSASSSNE